MKKIFSQDPKHQKIAMLYNYVDRAIKLSDEKYHDENITKVKSFFNENESKNYNRVVVIPFVEWVYERISHRLKNYQINVVSKPVNSLNNITKGTYNY